jgi:translation initiation factor 4E
MQKVGEFENIHEFWQFWNYIPHASPSSLFENPETRVKVIVEPLNSSVEAICVFESTSEPSAEDASNKSGSLFFFELDSFDPSQVKTCWDKIVFGLIGETFNSSLDIVGCRVLDKGKNVRFEIWTRFDGNNVKNSAKNLAIRETMKNCLDIREVVVVSHMGN